MAWKGDARERRLPGDLYCVCWVRYTVDRRSVNRRLCAERMPDDLYNGRVWGRTICTSVDYGRTICTSVDYGGQLAGRSVYNCMYCYGVDFCMGVGPVG